MTKFSVIVRFLQPENTLSAKTIACISFFNVLVNSLQHLDAFHFTAPSVVFYIWILIGPFCQEKQLALNFYFPQTMFNSKPLDVSH